MAKKVWTAQDEEERERRRAQVEAQRAQQVAENQARAQASEAERQQHAAKLTNASRPSAEVQQKVQEENRAMQAEVAKQTAGKPSPSQYKHAYEVEEFDGNYGKFKGNRDAYTYAGRIQTDEQRDKFLRGWADYNGGQKYSIEELRSAADSMFPEPIYTSSKQKKQAARDSLKPLSGLYDVDGNAINIQTADFNTVVQGIRNTADSAKRNALIEALEKSTKTEGSRFYGMTVDKDLAKTYLSSPDFTQDDYDAYVEQYDNSFYPQSGHDEANHEQYRQFYEEIENDASLTDTVKRQLFDRLDTVYQNSTGKRAPDINNLREVKAAEDALNEAKTGLEGAKTEEEKNFWQGALDKAQATWDKVKAIPGEVVSGEAFMDDEWLEDRKKEEAGPRERPPFMSDLPGYSGTYASATMSDVVPPIQTQDDEEKPMSFEAWVAAGKPRPSTLPTTYKVNDIGDVANAYFSGKLDLVDDSNPLKQEFKERYGKSSTFRRVTGTIEDETLYAQAMAGNIGGERAVQNNLTALGAKGYDALSVVMSEDYPAELRGDGYMVIANLGYVADQLAESGKLLGTDMESNMSRLLDVTPEEIAALDPDTRAVYEKAQADLASIYSARDEVLNHRAELAAQEEEANRIALEEARTAVKLDQASEEQREMVAANAEDIGHFKLYATDSGYAQIYDQIQYWDWGYFGEGGGYETSDVYKVRGMKSMEDDSVYRGELSTQMQLILEEDAEKAHALGEDLNTYYERAGGINMNALCQRAANRIAKMGNAVTDEEIKEYGEGIGAGDTIALGITHGFNDLYRGYADTLYVGMSEANVIRAAGNMQTKYQGEFGLMGRDMYRRDIAALLDSGKLDDRYAEALRRAMNDAQDVYMLGIDPQAYGFVRDTAAAARENIKLIEAYIGENATAGEQYAFRLTSSTLRNSGQMLISTAATIATGNPKAGFAIGYSGADLGENIMRRMDQKFERGSANFLGYLDTGVTYLANVGPFGNAFDAMFGGALDLDGFIFNQLQKNPIGLTSGMNAVKKYARKAGMLRGAAAFATNILEEAVSDPLKEGFGNKFVEAVVVPIVKKRDAGEEIGVADYCGALLEAVSPAGTINRFIDTLGDVKEGFVEEAVGSTLFALASGIGAARATSRSIKTAHKVASSLPSESLLNSKSGQLAMDIIEGRSTDIAGFIDAYKADMETPEFVQAFNEAAKQQMVDQAIMMNLMNDDGSDGKLEAVRKLNEQVASHEAAAANNKTAMETAQAILTEKQALIDAGQADDTDVQMAVDAAMEISKNKTGYDEHVREAAQKRIESKKIMDEKMQTVREEAVQEVEARMIEADQAVANSAQQADLQRQADNLTALDADNFIAERYPDASEEQKQQIREQFASNRQRLEGLRSGVELLSKAKKKFGFNVKLVDDLGGAEGGYLRSSNTIYVTKDITQSEAVKRVLLHEMTHATEATGGAYSGLRDALIKFRYGDDKVKLEADINSIMNRYNSHFEKNGMSDRIDREGALQEVIADINSEILSGKEEIVNRLVSEAPSVARRVWETIKDFLQKLGVVKDTEIDQIRRVADMFEKALNKAQTQRREFNSDGIQYSLREKAAPKNVVYAYKAFYAKDGKLYPPMVANITEEADKQKVKGATSGTMKSLPTPVGVWLDADVGGIMVDENGEPVRSKDTKRLRVKNDKSGGSASLAFRPGWHLGEWPDAKQFNKADPETGERGKRMPNDLVFAKCEVSADIDYQLDALSYGINEKGGFSRSQAGLPEIPVDGYYKYRTNVDPTTAPWLIAGSIKVVEILDDDDCARICAEYGVTPDKRVSGEKINLAKYGLKRGPVEESVEGMEKFKENDANRANKALLDRALSDPRYSGAYVQRDIDFDNPAQYEQLKKEFSMNGQDIEQYRKLYETRGFASERRAQPVAESKGTGEPLVGEIRGSVMQYSLRSWTDEERDTVRGNLINRGFEPISVEQWIDDVDGVARIIAADRDRLDFTAADNQVMLKPNQEYVKTLDASTLCAKRLLYQGTFNAIQHAMPDTPITSDGLIALRNMMAEMGYETPCGICYVESRRRNLGTFAKQWLDEYDAQGGYQPNLDDVTTTDGLERMRTEHPEVYKSFTDEMNRKGSNNPKVVQLRTDYRGDIRSLTKKQAEKIVEIGGLRVQSFSDFETPHLLDMMQAVLDMTEKGLTSQAYTKVPNFAAVFGDTGIKINLSLIADGTGLDENGNLVFSSYEGMDFDRAMELRSMYSKNVGTILVGLSDEHIKAAMADPRIDFIIPFHKSGWGQKQLEALTAMRGYQDYTADQNEKRVKGQTKSGKPTYKNVSENFHPVDYWDYSKSGKENAETYLRMCAEDGRVPKFSQFLVDNGDGSYSLPEDGSADGYWKLLIDFKMYDNDGVGSPQMPVMPNFNMEEAQRVLDEYEGGADTLPVAQDVVDRYVNEFDGMQFSLSDIDRYDEKSYNKRGWMHVNDILTIQEYNTILNRYSDLQSGGYAYKNADGATILSIGKEFGVNPAVVVTDGNYEDPSFERVYLINKNTETQIEKARDTIVGAEEVLGREAWSTIQGTLPEGLVERYDRRDFEPYSTIKQEFGVGRAGANGGETVGSGSGKHDGRGVPRRSRRNVRGKMQLSLPNDNLLNQEISDWQTAQRTFNQDPPQETQRPLGERQFTTKTLQNSQAVPQWAKDALYSNPNARFYEKDTNDDQIARSWERLQSEGYEAMRDRLLKNKTDLTTADNIADANMVMAMAKNEGDMQTFLDMAMHYAEQGTQAAQALQARKTFSKMTPTGMARWAAGQSETKLAEYIREHRPIQRMVDRTAQKVADKIRNKQGGDEMLRLQASGTYTITSEDARWGVPLNEKQRALIKEYGLEKVKRPGIHYNRATLKQRMLEAILAEPNPENVTGNGLNLIQRLEYMKAGAAVITNADLDYMIAQMETFTHLPIDEQEERLGDLALARLYEAYGNIKPASGRDKRRAWRYTATLLSVPSAGRNVIGNAAQNSVNAASHGVATALDSLISHVTGERTVATLSMKERMDGWRAFRDETVNTFRDFYSDKAITSHGDDRFNMNQRGRVFENSTLEAARNLEGFLMSVGDRNFWKKAYVNSLAEQQRVADLNGEAFDYEAACVRAEAEANYATFNEDSSVRNLLNQLKNPPENASEWGHALAFAIDYLMPFTGVPTNITKRMLQYSPVGLVVTALKHGKRAAQGKNFNQLDFVNGMSRGLTGSAMLYIGAELFKAGLIMLGTGEEEDQRIYGAETAQGKQYSPYIRIGDEYISLSTFMPADSALIMGAATADIFANNEDALDTILSASLANLDMVFDASYMSALADVFGGYGSLGENVLDSLVNSTVSMNAPAMLGQIATAMDPYVRDTKDKNVVMQALKSGLIAKIPGLREELLEAKVDITGEKIKSKGFSALIDPLTRTEAKDDPVLQELIDIARSEGTGAGIPDLFVKGNKFSVDITKTQAKALRINYGKDEDGKRSYQAMSLDVTDEEKWALNEAYGKLVYSELEKLMSTSKWRRADDETRIELAKDIISEAKLDILEDFVKKRGIE